MYPSVHPPDLSGLQWPHSQRWPGRKSYSAPERWINADKGERLSKEKKLTATRRNFCRHVWQQKFFNAWAFLFPFSSFRLVKTFPYILTVLTVLQFKNRYTVYSFCLAVFRVSVGTDGRWQFLFSKFRNSGYRIQNTVFPKHFSSSVSSVDSWQFRLCRACYAMA